MKWNTTTLAGTATLSALVVILDYALKYSNLKIPFSFAFHLKFDFTRIPVVMSRARVWVDMCTVWNAKSRPLILSSHRFTFAILEWNARQKPFV
jgi:hypothetical protein